MAHRRLFTSLSMLFVVLGCDGNEDKKSERSGKSSDLEAQVCEEACACSEDDDEGCESECQDELAEVPKACKAQKDAYLRCASKAEWVCEDGEGAVEGCDRQLDAVEQCESEGEDNPIADVPTRDAATPREDAGRPPQPSDVTDAGSPTPRDPAGPASRDAATPPAPPLNPPSPGPGMSEPLACAPRADDTACASCWKDSCCQSFSACMNSPACRDLVSCMASCTGAQRDACTDACAAKSPGGVSLLTTFVDCSSESCDDAC